MRFPPKLAKKIAHFVNNAQPEICSDVAVWAHDRGIPVIRLADPLYHEVRSFFSNEEMAVAMVDTHREVLSRPQSLVLIEGARIRETLGLVELPDGQVLLEGNWWLPSLQEHPTYKKRIGFKRHRIRGDVYSLLAMWSTSYYHWFHDVLPRLEAAFPHLPRGTRFLINQNPAHWQLDTLAAYGIQGEDLEIQPSDARTKIERLWFSTPAGQTGFGSQGLLKKVSSRLRSHFGTTTEERRCGLYVSRSKSRYRRVVNEGELLANLPADHFKRVHCEDFTIQEQVALFWNASWVLAPHGAGLTNIMFCRSGTGVGEVHYAETVYNDHYWMLAQQLGLRHSHLGAKKLDLPDGQYDLEADLIAVEKWGRGAEKVEKAEI
jgi:capsular polysaccharide biosynthesis protein